MSRHFKPIDPIEEIKKIYVKKGVTILLDDNADSDLVQIGSLYSYDKNDKILKIDAHRLNRKDKELLHAIILKKFNDGDLLFKRSRVETLNSYSLYESIHKDHKILDFFRDKLPPKDFYALKMSLYLRNQALLGKNISVYKRDIGERFGERGINIANLCTAGYFDIFKEVYNPDKPEEFRQYYELVVGKKAIALFINQEMGVADIEREVLNMIEKAEKYHIPEFWIHGKGTFNIKNIKQFLTSRGRGAANEYKIELVYEIQSIPIVEYKVTITKE
jgi:hypothetical protein